MADGTAEPGATATRPLLDPVVRAERRRATFVALLEGRSGTAHALPAAPGAVATIMALLRRLPRPIRWLGRPFLRLARRTLGLVRRLRGAALAGWRRPGSRWT